jgi:hypothetical protein
MKARILLARTKSASGETLLPRATRRRVLPSAILFICDVLHPLDRLAVESLLNGDVVMAVERGSALHRLNDEGGCL